MGHDRHGAQRAAAGEKNLAAHQDVHGEQGALSGEHPGRAADPTINVSGLAWLEFDRPDLDRSERFALDFGLDVDAAA